MRRFQIQIGTTLATLALIMFSQGAWAQNPKKPIHDGKREQSQVSKEFNKAGLDLIPNQAELTPSDFNYFPGLMQTLLQIEANTLSTTAEVFQAVENLEKIYRATIKASDQHFDDMNGIPYQEPDSRLYMSKQVQDALGELEKIRNGMAKCQDNENCVTEIDGKILTFRELAAMYDRALRQNGEFYRAYAKSLVAWDQATQVYEFRVREAYNKIVPVKMAKLRQEINESPDMSADEKAYHIQYWNNIQLQNKLEQLEQQALKEPALAQANKARLEALRTEFAAVKDLLEAQAQKECGAMSWSCKKERSAAKEKLEDYKKLLGLRTVTVGGKP